MTEVELKPGLVVRHRKGGTYEIVSIATHSETHERLVVYRNVDHSDVWARPLAMFLDPGRFSRLPTFALGDRVRQLRSRTIGTISQVCGNDRYWVKWPPLDGPGQEHFKTDTLVHGIELAAVVEELAGGQEQT